MKTVTWNKEQQCAITERNCNILVSAGAGSGKTAVLTERIVSLIKEGCSILDFAICTFTEDATMEMKNRIREKLLDSGLDEQADMVYTADISTIHSLCKKIIMDNFDLVGLPPKFTILSSEDIMLEQAVTNTLNRIFEDKEFTAFALKFAPSDNNKIIELLLTAYNFCMNIPNYQSFLHNQINMYKTKDYSLIKHEYCRIKTYFIQNIIASYNCLLEELPLSEKELKLVHSDLTIMLDIEKNIQANNLNICEASFDKMPNGAEHKTEIDPVRKNAKEFVKDIKNYKALADCDKIMYETGLDLQQLLKGVTVLEEEYSAIKLNNGYLTFNDLEQYAYKILLNDKAAAEYQQRYKYIFVDEYQDTSRLQQAILNRLSGNHNLFMVGDVKQSIYGFRNADPSMFHKIYNEYDNSGQNIKIDLFRNYRSSKNILNCINDVFSILLNLSEEYYPKEAYLITDINNDDTPVEIDLINPCKDEYDKSLNEARHILSRIQESISAGYECNDIAVLFDSVKSPVATELYSLLRQEGIPADISSNSDKLYVETRLFIDLIKIIDNTDNDIPLISVMFSDIGKFTIDDLIEIKKGQKESFYHCVKSYSGDISLEQRINSFLNMLNDFSCRSRNMSIDELMSAVLMHTGYLKQVEKYENSRAKVSQLYHLIKSAKEFESMGYYGVSGFLEYFTALESLKKVPEMAGFVQGSNAVSIMTMHKSKGLEFPVVIIGNLNKQLYNNKDKGYIACDKNMGIGLCYIDTQKRARIQTPMMELINEQSKINTLEEKMRLLYVAMTRAKQRMYITGTISDADIEKLQETRNVDVQKLLGGNTTFLNAFLSAVYAGRTKSSGKYIINRIQIEEPIKTVKSPIISPKYNSTVSNMLDEVNDTSTVTIPRKASVTELTKDEHIFVPYVSKGKKTNNEGALAGTVTHGVLYHLRQNESLDELLERMKQGEYFTEKELSLIDRDMIEHFTSSSLYRRICSSPKVYKEKPFILELNPADGYSPEPVMVQGIIDCIFEENGSYILVDYKTDNIVKNAEEILREKYKKQLDLYALAIDRLTNKKVKEKLIFHLKTGKIIDV